MKKAAKNTLKNRGILLTGLIIFLAFCYLYTLKGQLELGFDYSDISTQAQKSHPYNPLYRITLSLSLIASFIGAIGIWFWKKWAITVFILGNLAITSVAYFLPFQNYYSPFVTILYFLIISLLLYSAWLIIQKKKSNFS